MRTELSIPFITCLQSTFLRCSEHVCGAIRSNGIPCQVGSVSEWSFEKSITNKKDYYKWLSIYVSMQFESFLLEVV